MAKKPAKVVSLIVKSDKGAFYRAGSSTELFGCLSSRYGGTPDAYKRLFKENSRGRLTHKVGTQVVGELIPDMRNGVKGYVSKASLDRVQTEERAQARHLVAA